MSALAHLHMHGLKAESLPGERIAVWPEEAITPSLESWIVHHKPKIISELRRTQPGSLNPWEVFRDGKRLATMLSPCSTHQEAEASARARWPRHSITVRALASNQST